ncbi:HsmA family protein [Paenibacillus sp. N3.4]|uniref:HsmA family protein n=1 Tax=Paenibacillus sp. N3.4 TaxID=2603222 RepID=UPI001C9CB05D|nr:HsmA family protein [Paenibacillus sp. N3.4]
MLPYAVILITLALVFYTIGVWAENIQGVLKKWHLGMFCLGLVFDTSGTYVMGQLAKAGSNQNGSFHLITGALALILMLIHAIWAFIVLYKNAKQMLQKFHKLSVIVWIIWLIPFLSGMIYSMLK